MGDDCIPMSLGTPRGLLELKFLLTERHLCSFLLIIVEGKVLVPLRWPEHVEHKHVECHGGHLLSHNTHPSVLVVGDCLEGIHNDPSEVQVSNHDDIKLAEERELGKGSGRLAVCLG